MPDPWAPLFDGAGRRIPAFQRALLAAVARARAGATADALAARLRAGDTTGAFELAWTAWQEAAAPLGREITRQLRDALEAGGEAARVIERGRLLPALDITNPEAVRWAQTRSAELVREISAETRQVIRAVIVRAFRDGLAPDDTARELRGVIGLTTRQEQAVAAFRDRLNRLRERPPGSAADTNLRRVSNRGLTADRVNDLVAQYQARLLRQRTTTIARTEIMTASHEGQRQLWSQAVQDGALRPDNQERRWIVTPDDRLCPLCQALEGARAALDGGKYPGGIPGPPLHPNCRCTEGLVEAR